MSRESVGVRLALAVVAACSAAGALYAGLRMVQKLLFTEPDPALVLWSEHAGYFWRAWTAAYVGGMAGFIAYVAAGKNPEGTSRVLATSIVVTIVSIAVQGILVP